jgi:mono/diheme cytochrome c family protein
MKLKTPLTLLLALGSLSSCYHFRSWRVPSDATPEVMYDRAGCAACHGADRWGTEQAPSLRNLAAHWSVQELAEYIAEPSAHRDERLEAIAAEYEAEMPGSGFLSREQRESLAEWLLGSS